MMYIFPLIDWVGVARMGQSQIDSNEHNASEALAHLEAALAILDELEIPADVGAYVDLAISRLRDRLQVPEDN